MELSQNAIEVFEEIKNLAVNNVARIPMKKLKEEVMSLNQYLIMKAVRELEEKGYIDKKKNGSSIYKILRGE